MAELLPGKSLSGILEAMKRAACLLGTLAALVLSAAAGADELRLKDGTVIVGTIVGFEDNSFRVKTSYGFALVRKEMVAEIFIREESPPDQPRPANPSAAARPAESAPNPSPQIAAAPANPAPSFPESAREKTDTPNKGKPPVAAPVPKPEPKAPEPMRFEVDGTSYVNLTFGFRLYKPPGWRVVEGAHERLPNAVVAMATPDERTFLVVSREPLAGSLEEHVREAAQQLQRRYENFRALGEERANISAAPAIERRFRAWVDGYDWSGRLAWVAHGDEVFTLFGMTRAETELVQIHENIIARVMASLEFTQPKAN